MHITCPLKTSEINYVLCRTLARDINPHNMFLLEEQTLTVKMMLTCPRTLSLSEILGVLTSSTLGVL